MPPPSEKRSSLGGADSPRTRVTLRVAGPYKDRGSLEDQPVGAAQDQPPQRPTWRCPLQSCSPWWSSPCWWLAVQRRHGTSRWPVQATTRWAGRPACCPASGGHRTSGEPSRTRRTATSWRPAACFRSPLSNTSSWRRWSVGIDLNRLRLGCDRH